MDCFLEERRRHLNKFFLVSEQTNKRCQPWYSRCHSLLLGARKQEGNMVIKSETMNLNHT